MAYTDIDDPTQHFNTIVWTGAGDTSARSFTGVGFQPDWVWHKCRTDTYNHHFYDSVRGAGNNSELIANSTVVEGGGAASEHGYLSSFDTDGFSSANGTSGTGGNLGFNQNSETFVAWNWKAATSFSNDASATGVGTIDSTGKVNTTAGFSIISFTGTGSNATVAHGLGSKLDLYIVRNRSDTEDWIVYHGANTSAPETDYLALNLTNATGDSSGVWNDTAPTSSVFSVGTANSTNGSSDNMIAYCFTEKQGYSKFGSYKGNGNANGAFIYTGFKPAWIMVKPIDATQNWQIHDLKRLGYNIKNYNLSSNSTATEAENDFMDIVSNGFKIKRADVLNVSTEEYIYWAFAEAPFVNSSGVPNNAR